MGESKQQKQAAMGMCGTEEEQPKTVETVENVGPVSDGTCTLAPYFKLKEGGKFKELWKADYAKFAHKDDCVHYAFTFTEDGRALCREAYKNAEGVIQHITDVLPVFHDKDPETGCIHPDNAELEKLEFHGPASEIEKIKASQFAGLPWQFFVVEWSIRPARPAMENDTVVHLYPYFKLNNSDAFKKIWQDVYQATKDNVEAEKSHQYAFSFCDDYMGGGKFASCRESYADAESVMLHIKNVGGTFHGNDPETGCIHPDNADLDHLELHGPASEIEKMKNSDFAGLPWTYFITEWGFRNETK